MAPSAEHPDTQAPERPGAYVSTPSDQLLALFAVNVILVCWVGLSFWRFHNPDPPSLPVWLYLAEAFILLGSFALSAGPQLKAIAKGAPASVEIGNENIFLKGAVFLFTGLSIVVIWQLAEETGGVMSPYAPFLPAPAIFGAFVTKKPETIIGLSGVVAIFIGFSSFHVPSPPPDVWAYRGSAAVMVLLAGMLSWLRARVANSDRSLAGQATAKVAKAERHVDESDAKDDWPDLNDDDLAPGMEG